MSRTPSRDQFQDQIAKHASYIAAHIVEAGLQAIASIEAARAEAEARIRTMAPAVEFDVKAAAEFLGVSVRTLQRRVSSRAIAYRRDGARLLFTRHALEQYRRNGTVDALE